ARDAEAVTAPDAADVEQRLVAEAVWRTVPRLSDGPAQLDLVDERHRAEQAIRRGGLRKHEPLIAIAVGAAAVGAESRREEEPLIQRQDFLLGIEGLVARQA